MGTSQQRKGYHQVNNFTMASPSTRKLCYLALVLAFAISDTVSETENIVCNAASQTADTVLESDGEIIWKKPRKNRQERCGFRFTVDDSALEEKPYLIIDFSAGFNVPKASDRGCASHLSFQVVDILGNTWDSIRFCGKQKTWNSNVYVIDLTSVGGRTPVAASYVISTLEVEKKNGVAKKAGFKIRYYMASEFPADLPDSA